jgi:hypothetical protein
MGKEYVPHLQNVLESLEWGHLVVATAPMIHNFQGVGQCDLCLQ